ncbi:MAG: serine/threonine protein kinase [Myxococcales bacterium]|nr:serine/threonine protein kinase [Myxococcales bacterium]
MKLEVGQVVQGYRVERPLGAGGTAVVHLVTHVEAGTQHALKVLSISSPAIRERMLREGRVQSTLQHANVVAVDDVLELQGAPALLMEFVEGPSLEAALKRYRLTMSDAELLFAGILDGVRAAHAAGLVHRDLKPANVLLARTPEGFVPKVTDFGLAKMLVHQPGAAHTKAGISMGTPSYMAPEQIRDARSVDQRADIWSLGCLLYELTTRQRAFPGDQALAIYNAVVDADYLPPRRHVPELPDRINQAILGCLRLDPGDRMPDCDTLAEVLSGELPWEVEEELILGRPLPEPDVPPEPFDPDIPMMPLASRDSITGATASTGPRSSLVSSLSGSLGAGASIPPDEHLKRRQVVSSPLLPGISDSLSDDDLLPGGPLITEELEPTVEHLPRPGGQVLDALGGLQSTTSAGMQESTVLMDRDSLGTLSPQDSLSEPTEGGLSDPELSDPDLLGTPRSGGSDWVVWVGFFGLLSMVAMAAIAVMVGAVVSAKFPGSVEEPTRAETSTTPAPTPPPEADRAPTQAAPAPVKPKPSPRPAAPPTLTKVRLQTFPYGSEIRVAGQGSVGHAPQIVKVPTKVVGAQVKDDDRWVSFSIELEEGATDYCLMVPTRQVHVGKCPVSP